MQIDAAYVSRKHLVVICNAKKPLTLLNPPALHVSGIKQLIHTGKADALSSGPRSCALGSFRAVC